MKTSGQSNLVEIAAELRGQTSHPDGTPRAYKLHDGANTEWVPASMVEVSADGRTWTMPEWLAKEKGFI